MKVGGLNVRLARRHVRWREFWRLEKWYVEVADRRYYRRCWRWMWLCVNDAEGAKPSNEGARLWQERWGSTDPLRGVPPWQQAPGGDA